MGHSSAATATGWTPPPRTRARARRLASPPLVLAVWLVLATLAQLVRSPGLPAWNVLWAEDGTIFL